MPGVVDQTVSRGLISAGTGGIVQPVTRHDGGLEGGAFRARVIEREGLEGQLGEWKELSTGKKIMNKLRGKSESQEEGGVMEDMEMVGEVDGLVGGLGEKTVTVPI